MRGAVNARTAQTDTGEEGEVLREASPGRGHCILSAIKWGWRYRSFRWTRATTVSFPTALSQAAAATLLLPSRTELDSSSQGKTEIKPRTGN